MYEDAPATKMLATHCAACERPLLDAESVSAGLGPICRKRNGVPQHLPEETRQRANKLIWACATRNATPEILTAAVIELYLLDCHKLAERISERAGRVKLTVHGLSLHVEAPFSEAFLAARGPGRWSRQARAHVYPLRDAYAALTAIRTAYGPAATVRLGNEFFRADDDRLEGSIVGLVERGEEHDPAPVQRAPQPRQAPKPVKGVGHPRRLDSGEWGVQLLANEPVSAGDRIVVRTKNGKEWYAELAQRVSQGPRGYALWRTVRC